MIALNKKEVALSVAKTKTGEVEAIPQWASALLGKAFSVMPDWAKGGLVAMIILYSTQLALIWNSPDKLTTLENRIALLEKTSHAIACKVGAVPELECTIAETRPTK